MSAALHAALVWAVLVGLAGAAHASGGRLTVCTVSFQGPDEVAAFRANLSPGAFDVVALAPAPGAASGTGGSPCVRDACPPDRRRAVGHVWGEFGVRYFADA